jgi:hypothetical protein
MNRLMARKSGLSTRCAPDRAGLNQIVARIEVFADMICPFPHVGLRRLREVRWTADRRVAVRIRAWPLEWINGAALAPDVVARGDRKSARDRRAGAVRRFRSRHVPVGIHSEGTGSRPPRMGLDDPTGEAVSLALRDALFEEGIDISDSS